MLEIISRFVELSRVPKKIIVTDHFKGCLGYCSVLDTETPETLILKQLLLAN